MNYSFKKGFWKFLYSALGVGIMVLTFTSFAEVSLWEIMERYVKPLLGTMTIAGAITLARNYIKVKRM